MAARKECLSFGTARHGRIVIKMLLPWRTNAPGDQIMASYNHLFKVIIVGNSNVGKSCLLLRFVDGRYRNDHEVTIGIDFGIKIIETKGVRVKLHIWDCCGMETFLSICIAYYRSAAAALLVYDVGNKASFERIVWWCDNVKKHCSREIALVLIGNKSDKADRDITYEEGLELATSIGAEFYETSAKDAKNVNEAFYAAAHGAMLLESKSSVELYNTAPMSASAKSDCCVR